jgi:hypothetical protein
VKFSNFKHTVKVEGKFFSGTDFAEVDMSERKWFKTTTRRIQVFKPEQSDFWRFQETGEYAPLELEKLAEAATAAELLKRIGKDRP